MVIILDNAWPHIAKDINNIWEHSSEIFNSPAVFFRHFSMFTSYIRGDINLISAQKTTFFQEVI